MGPWIRDSWPWAHGVYLRALLIAAVQLISMMLLPGNENRDEAQPKTMALRVPTREKPAEWVGISIKDL